MRRAALSTEYISAASNGRDGRIVRHRWNRDEALVGYLFILPLIVGFLVFVLYPLLFSAHYAFTSWDGLSAPMFIGLDNFCYMFTKDKSFSRSLSATILVVVLTVQSSLILGLGLAVLLNRQIPGVR